MLSDAVLSDFIVRKMEAILANWEAFAATCLPAATHMQSVTLRDHAKQILEAVAIDLRTSQTSQAQELKSLGLAPPVFDAPATAAQTHALLRANSGFDIIQLAAEYRALRASVLRLWMAEHPSEGPPQDELIRFNEAIDQALAESIAVFHARVEQSRNLLLGMLGHDMRTPLQAIQMTAAHLSRLNAGFEVSESAARLIRGGASIKALLDDLTDFSRTQLGLGIGIDPVQVDLAPMFAEELAQIRAAYPHRKLELRVAGDCSGELDVARIRQLLGNLVTNAIKYGDPSSPVHVDLTGGATDICIEVENEGATIDDETIVQLFEPLKRGPDHAGTGSRDQSLGLGLFIVREIAKAHGGSVRGRSAAGSTVFTVVLPRLYAGAG